MSISTQPNVCNQDHETVDKNILSNEDSEKSSSEPSREVSFSQDRASVATEETNQHNLSKDSSPAHSAQEKERQDKPISSSQILTRRTPAVTEDSEETARSQESPSHHAQTNHQPVRDQSTPTRTPTHTPEVQITKVDAKKTGGKGQPVSGREVVCIVLAIVMRIMLACDWLTEYTGQVRSTLAAKVMNSLGQCKVEFSPLLLSQLVYAYFVVNNCSK